MALRAAESDKGGVIPTSCAKWSQSYRMFWNAHTVIRNTGSAGRREDHSENQFLRKSFFQNRRVSSCELQKASLWHRAWMEMLSERNSFCCSTVHSWEHYYVQSWCPLLKDLSSLFLTDSSTKVRKIWETSRKSLSQGTITQPGWAAEPLPFPSQHSSSMVTGQARKFCSLPLRQQLFFQVLFFSLLLLSTGVITEGFLPHTQM